MKRFLTIAILTLALFIIGYLALKKNNREMDNRKTHVFAEKLLRGEYGIFFRYPMHEETLDKIWQDTANRKLMDAVIADPSTAGKAKFLCCVVFFEKEGPLRSGDNRSFFERHGRAEIAEIYAEALQRNYIGMANSWGFLYPENDCGTIGLDLVSIGAPAVPVLFKLLNDSGTTLRYLGSEEATVGNRYHYRVKDFAAFYVGRILQIPLKYYADWPERDTQIEHLKQEVVNRKLDR